MTSPLSYDRLRELLEAATPGPWEMNPDGMYWSVGMTYGVPAIGMDDARYYPSAPSADDAALIVAAVNALPDLLTRIADLEGADDRADRYEDALQRIKQWAEAYPLDIFPEPDFAVCHQLLRDGGQSLGAVSASNMRHVVEGVGKIAAAALRALSGTDTGEKVG